MKKTLAAFLAALTMLGIPLTASATGGLDCSISDDNLDFHFEALFSYSANSPLFQSKAEFVSKHPKTFAGLKELDSAKLGLIQQWYEDKDLRLQFYAETEGDDVPFAAVKLSIKTTADEDEIGYHGTYVFEVTPAVVPGAESDTIRLEGPVACSAG